MQNVAMKVVLGSSSLRAFVAAPKYLTVLGVVRMGQEFGLLATNDEGTYLRVNGSQNVELDANDVRRALQVARVTTHQSDSKQHEVVRKPPVVAVRKRRHALLPCAS